VVYDIYLTAIGLTRSGVETLGSEDVVLVTITSSRMFILVCTFDTVSFGRILFL
jgi:hypothetical protein